MLLLEPREHSRACSWHQQNGAKAQSQFPDLSRHEDHTKIQMNYFGTSFEGREQHNKHECMAESAAGALGCWRMSCLMNSTKKNSST
jgi:hypothetical protein